MPSLAENSKAIASPRPRLSANANDFIQVVCVAKEARFFITTTDLCDEVVDETSSNEQKPSDQIL